MQISKKSPHYKFVHWTFGDFEVEASLFTYVLAFIGSVWVFPIRACLVGVKNDDAKEVLPLVTMTIGLMFGTPVVVVLIAMGLYPMDATGAEALTSAGLNIPINFLGLDILVLMAVVIIGRVVDAVYNACRKVRVRFI